MMIQKIDSQSGLYSQNNIKQQLRIQFQQKKPNYQSCIVKSVIQNIHPSMVAKISVSSNEFNKKKINCFKSLSISKVVNKISSGNLDNNYHSINNNQFNKSPNSFNCPDDNSMNIINDHSSIIYFSQISQKNNSVRFENEQDKSYELDNIQQDNIIDKCYFDSKIKILTEMIQKQIDSNISQENKSQRENKFNKKTPLQEQKNYLKKSNQLEYQNDANQILNKITIIQQRLNKSIVKDRKKVQNPMKKQLSLNPLQYLKLEFILGKGKFSTVKMVTDIRTGISYALKIMDKLMINRYQMHDQVKNEIKIQSMMNHPNIVKMYSFFSDDENIYLLLELCPEGNLYKYLNSKEMEEIEVANIITQVVWAIKELHSNHIIHRDIKPENIMKSYNEYKLTDLGCAVYSPQEDRDTFCGTLDYVSPELALGQKYSYHVDLWAIGVLAYELLMGEPPFLDTTCKGRTQTLQNIIQAPIKFKKNVSVEFKDFIGKLLVRDAKKRIDSTQILQHKWIIKNFNPQIIDFEI